MITAVRISHAMTGSRPPRIPSTLTYVLTSPTSSDANTTKSVRTAGIFAAVRVFLGGLMLPESAALMLRLDVVVDGKVVEYFEDLDAALARAAELDGARVMDELRLPDRVLLQLVDWVIELYSGGQRPPTQSAGSSKASRPAGTRGTATSRSGGSTRARGR